MARFIIEYSDRETINDQLCERAASLNISPEELIKRFVDAGMDNGDQSPSIAADSLDNFFVKNGTLNAVTE
ncbi:hypothetical protein O59_002496 [Cellvibrio sp. BR]|uniref:hypothetical protein n=1 Tax=Cellvibrio sp. BR TaxID=1134474 RepID=UPI00026012F4|nr:hypothetical protein [Cellvibrio sp. BR]EIK44773.1 hypothetical protein O59_002496 [Cellvibrio sp. BR]